VSSPLFTPSSVTRWLTVVVGCAILEMAQPMIAAEPSSPAARSGDTLLFPGGAPAANDPASPRPAPPASAAGTLLFVALAGAAAGGLWWWRRGRPAASGRRGTIQIEDTRPLGNRQFLVVASCDGRRFLLGVAAGGIQMLSPLDPREDADEPRR
jgi:flagellar protein FliO/FliZ